MSNANFLENLLDGVEVEWKALGEVVTLRRGRVMSKEYLVDNFGEYPVYSSQTASNGEIGKINTFDTGYPLSSTYVICYFFRR